MPVLIDRVNMTTCRHRIMMRGCLQLKFSRAAAVQQWGKSYSLVVPTRRLLKRNKYVGILSIAVTTLQYITISMITIFSMYIAHVR